MGLWPLPGPRGLLRIYAPYLGHADVRVINFLAVEPIPAGSVRRGYSELEQSFLDGEEGKRFWSTDSPDDPTPRVPQYPARGVVSSEGAVETLTVYVFVEPFFNGARVYLRLHFRSDRPHEVGIATFSQPGSVALRSCIVTATMGNFARLRILHLRDLTVTATELWPQFTGNGFTPHACFSLDRLMRTPDGAVLFAATPDEDDPAECDYAPGTFVGWRYYGNVATQYWRCEDPPAGLTGCVNGRVTYWASDAPIPGGIAFENLELVQPFQEGAELWFGVRAGQLQRPRNLAEP